LTGDLPSVLAPPSFAQARRHLNTTGSNRQQGAAAAAAAAAGPSSNVAPQADFVFKPDSSLALSEQREKARLRAQRLEKEEQGRKKMEAELRMREEAARAHREREGLREQYRQQQNEASAKEQQKMKRGEERRTEQRKAREWRDDRSSRDARRRRDQRTGGENGSVVRTYGAGRRGDSRVPREDPRRDDPFGGNGQRQRGPPRVALPSFSAPAASEPELQPARGGWGAGPVKREEVKYSDAPPAPTNVDVGDARDLPSKQPDTAQNTGLFDQFERLPTQPPQFQQPANDAHAFPDLQFQQQPTPPQPQQPADNAHALNQPPNQEQPLPTIRASNRDPEYHYRTPAQVSNTPPAPTIRFHGSRQASAMEPPHLADASSANLRDASAGNSKPQHSDHLPPRPEYSNVPPFAPSSEAALQDAFAGSGRDQKQLHLSATAENAKVPGFASSEAALRDAFAGTTQQPSRVPPQANHNTSPFSSSSPFTLRDAFAGSSAPPPRTSQPSQPRTDGLGFSTVTGSTQRQQPSPIGDSGYFTELLGSKGYMPPAPSQPEEDYSADWQHLRRREAQPSPPPPPAAPPMQTRPRREDVLTNSDTVDQLFRQHQQERVRSPLPSPWQSTTFQDHDSVRRPSDFKISPGNRSRVCARCQQPGHHARDCRSVRVQAAPRQEDNVFTRPHSPTSHPEQERRLQQSENGDVFRGQRKERQDMQSRRDNPFATGAQNGQSQNGVARRVTERRTEKGFEESERHSQSASVFGDAPRVAREWELKPMVETAPSPAAQEERERERPARRGRFRPDVEEDASADIRRRLSRRSRFEDEEDEGRGVRARRTFEDEPRREKGRGRRRDEEDEDDESLAAREERRALKEARRAREVAAKAARAAQIKAKQEADRTQVRLPEFVSVATLAQALGVRYEDFVQRLERLGYEDIFPGKVFNSETSGMIAMEYDFEPVFETGTEEEERDLKALPVLENKENLPTRPPVVTIMGHVDHGKTTILDYLRKSSVAAGEAGGITQHIGAFSVPLSSSGKTITFLDTPGHAAFLAMRQRGANVTDIVILVVAADDSVKPQTLEALKHAKAANVPIIVAVNKIDKEEADLQRVKQDLARHGVDIEDYGGETQVVPVSGKTGQGMDELEENIVTLSEILDHRADTTGPVEGWVLEATTKQAGRVATVLVRRGTLRPGSIIVAGTTWARVRTLRNEAGESIEAVGPGMPVEVDGWRDQPSAGDEVLQAPSEQKATDVVEFRQEKEEQKKLAQDMEVINKTRRVEQEKREKERAAQRAKKFEGFTDFFEAAAENGEAEEENAQTEQEEGQEKETGPISVPFIIKADVSGSVEAVSAYILSLSSPFVVPRILRSSVGSINETDIELAHAAKGHIIAFNLPPDEGMKGAAEDRGVRVLENNVIYRVLDDVKSVLEELLPPIVTQRVLGEAEVAAAFDISVGGRKTMKIAGCKVRNGMVSRGGRVRVLRGSEKVYDGKFCHADSPCLAVRALGPGLV
jgi:translation initiation factor IF-2